MDSSPTDPAVDRERERAVDVPSLAGGGSSRPAGVTDGREGQEDTDEQPPQATTTDGDDPASPPATVAGEGGDDGRTLALADETPSTRTASDGAAAAAEMDPPSTTSLTSLTQSLNEFERLPLESGIAIWSGGRLLALIDPTFSLAPPPGATLPPSTSALPTPEPPRPSRDEVLEAMSPIAQSAEISERASSELDALAQSFRSAVQAVPSASRNVVDERAHLLESLLVEVWDATEQVLAGEGRSGREALGRIADAVRGTSEASALDQTSATSLRRRGAIHRPGQSAATPQIGPTSNTSSRPPNPDSQPRDAAHPSEREADRSSFPDSNMSLLSNMNVAFDRVQTIWSTLRRAREELEGPRPTAGVLPRGSPRAAQELFYSPASSLTATEVEDPPDPSSTPVATQTNEPSTTPTRTTSRRSNKARLVWDEGLQRLRIEGFGLSEEVLRQQKEGVWVISCGKPSSVPPTNKKSGPATAPPLSPPIKHNRIDDAGCSAIISTSAIRVDPSFVGVKSNRLTFAMDKYGSLSLASSPTPSPPPSDGRSKKQQTELFMSMRAPGGRASIYETVSTSTKKAGNNPTSPAMSKLACWNCGRKVGYYRFQHSNDDSSTPDPSPTLLPLFYLFSSADVVCQFVPTISPLPPPSHHFLPKGATFSFGPSFAPPADAPAPVRPLAKRADWDANGDRTSGRPPSPTKEARDFVVKQEEVLTRRGRWQQTFQTSDSQAITAPLR